MSTKLMLIFPSAYDVKYRTLSLNHIVYINSMWYLYIFFIYALQISKKHWPSRDDTLGTIFGKLFLVAQMRDDGSLTEYHNFHK